MSRALIALALALVACSSPVKPATSSPPPPVSDTRDAGYVDADDGVYELAAMPDGRVIRMRIDAGALTDASLADSSIRFGRQGEICDGPNPAHCGPNLRCCYPCGTGGCRRICQPQCLPIP